MKGTDHTVDGNIKVKAAKWVEDSLHVEMLDGSVFVAPRRRLPELSVLTRSQLAGIEIIDGGRGILFGDAEGVSVRRLLDVVVNSADARNTGKPTR